MSNTCKCIALTLITKATVVNGLLCVLLKDRLHSSLILSAELLHIKIDIHTAPFSEPTHVCDNRSKRDCSTMKKFLTQLINYEIILVYSSEGALPVTRYLGVVSCMRRLFHSHMDQF